MQDKQFTTVLQNLEPKLSSLECRLMPSSFNPDDPNLQAVPRPVEWHWHAAEETLRAGKAVVAMVNFPFFWQLHTPLFKVCHIVGVPFFPNQSENMPVGAAAITQADVNFVFSAPKDAAVFSLFLIEKNIPLPPTWFLVHDVQETSWEIPAGLATVPMVVQEVHLCPGLPLLTQCPTQAQNKKGDFHLSEEFSWESKEGVISITMADKTLLPLEEYILPISLKENGTCSCGKRQFVRV